MKQSNIKDDLLENGHSFSFFQAIRVLKQLAGDNSINIKTNLSLGYQKAEIEEIEQTPKGFTITTNLAGLYGTGSPLPTFYTEELIEEKREDRSSIRDLIDIINNRLYSLLFQGWIKYKNMQRTAELCSDEHIQRLYCLIGIGEKEIRDDIERERCLLRYIGLLTQYPRSASGLKSILNDAFEEIQITIIDHVKRKAPVNKEQKCFLGLRKTTLGKDICLADRVVDNQKFRIRLGPLSEELFREFIPGTKKHKRLIFLTKFYLSEPYEFDIETVVKENAVKTTRPGRKKWSRLGIDTWIFSGKEIGTVSSISL